MVARRDSEPLEGQPGLFGEPEPEKLELSKSARPARVPPKYTDLTARTWNCMECEWLVYEQIMTSGNSGHLIRKARVKRVAGDLEEVLCIEHATLRKELDSAPRKKA